MSIAINSNQASTQASLNMKRISERLGKSLNRLSSGMRIVSPSDDAGGLAVGMKLQSALRRAKASMQNTQNGVSFLQMQDGVLKVAGDIIDRMAELKTYYNDISKNDTDRETYNHEFHELQKELGSLKRQKFNGVSLFAQTEPDNNAFKIITSDDGMGDHIELNRVGLFENLKSKFGADGELNTGSHGEYRQLVGDFSRDGGLHDAKPGYTSRDYSKGSVIFKDGVGSDGGYFLALKDIKSGALIPNALELQQDPNASWIRISDESGAGFSEAFPGAPVYSELSTKFNSNGREVAYLQGDVVKVPAHWASPGSYLFLKANTDVPKGFTIDELFDGNVGENGYFDYVGTSESTGKPTTEFVRANAEMAQPSLFTSGSASVLQSVMSFHSSNNHTPGYVSDGTNIYTPSHDWGVNAWNYGSELKEGDLFFDESPANANEHVLKASAHVKGQFVGNMHSADDFVLFQGEWYKANAFVEKGSHPPVDFNRSGAMTDTANAANTAFTEGSLINDATAAANEVYVATDKVRGDFNASDIVWGTWVRGEVGGADQWLKLASDEATAFGASNQGAFSQTSSYLTNDVVSHNGTYWKANGAVAASSNEPGTNGDWSEVSYSDMTATAVTNLGAAGWAGQISANSDAWTKINWDKVSNPEDDADFRDDITGDLADLGNANYWSKTHFGSLVGKTVDTNYEKGDNIYFQGKHYLYVSHLSSNDASLVNPNDDSFTEIEDLIAKGAVIELPMYVDTVAGGGSSDLEHGVYYRPNQELDYVSRLPNSGLVRTNSIERRTDSPLPPGDEIYNSSDDQFYGGLNAGNDGIYGTMDDFYASTASMSEAERGAHIDADADNNKDLLDTANGLEDFSVADFVDYIQSVANFRAVNGGTMSRLNYATNILEENQVNLEAARGRIMDVDMAQESARLAQQSVKLQASASMITQANQLNQIVLQLLQ